MSTLSSNRCILGTDHSEQMHSVVLDRKRETFLSMDIGVPDNVGGTRNKGLGQRIAVEEAQGLRQWVFVYRKRKHFNKFTV